MIRMRHVLAVASPLAALAALGAAALLMSTASAQTQAARSATVEVIITSNLWEAFYPADDPRSAVKDDIRDNMKRLTRKKDERLIVDAGGFSGLTMLMETDYRAGAFGFFLDYGHDAINLGQQESQLSAIELEYLIKRGQESGVKGFVSSITALETAYMPQWTPFVETVKKKVPFLIGGISRDLQHTLFLESDPMFPAVDHVTYTRQLVAEARDKGAFPILLADANARIVDEVARSVQGLPLIVSTSRSAQGVSRQVGETWIVERLGPSAIRRLEMDVRVPQNTLTIKKAESVELKAPTEAGFWPTILGEAVMWPPVTLPEIGAPLDNESWLQKMGHEADSHEHNLIGAAVMKKYPAANVTAHYYGLRQNGNELKRLIYIRHRLPHPYPGIFFLVKTNSQGVIEQVHFPFGLIVGVRPSRLGDWAQSMVGDDATRLERKMRDQQMEFYQALLMTDVYYALKILDDGAI